MYTRRDVVRVLGVIPALQAQPDFLARLNHRLLGRTGRWVTPLGLGGQASLQWTNKGIDPADIIVRAIGLGINYLDSANAYGPSQTNYQTAIWRLHLSAADSEYNAALRERLYFATKTGQRYAPTAISELRQSMTVMFGDGKGWVPDGAYLDAMQMHNVTTDQQVDQIFEGMDDRANLRTRDRIGVLAGLLDFRDGTNYTGLNPEHRHWIRHIGITGHQSSLVLMRALRMDQGNALDTLLVALNANDRNYCSHQHNVIPVAVAKGMGVIAMKAFADGVFYGKPARSSPPIWSAIRCRFPESAC
jgi:aryl-alcohol dehydrogenase-like predicted oxidoreductase